MRIVKYTSPVLLSLVVFNAYPLGEPAAIYCENMGYEYVIETNEQGESQSFCVLPDGTKVDATDFFKGKTKPEYSYCNKHGYDVVSFEEKIGDATIEKAYCVKGKQLRRSDSSTPNGIPMTELMQKNGDNWFKSDTFPVVKTQEGSSVLKAATTYPTSYDSRSLGIVNPARHQGSRGTCWAFATAACSEITYNKNSGSTGDKRKRVSESFIVWCLGGNTDVVRSSGTLFKTCPKDEGWMRNAMDAVQKNGVCLLEYYPYTTVQPSTCDHWNDPKIYPGLHYSMSNYNNSDALKKIIYEYGSVGVNMNVGDDFQAYSGGIFDMKNDRGEKGGHSVTLVGWGVSSSNEPYWILRNSWGTTWGEDGYMKLKMSTASFWQGDYMAPGEYIYQADNIAESNVVPSNGNITFIGSKTVKLQKGFKVNKGGKFKAKSQSVSHIAQTDVKYTSCKSNNASGTSSGFGNEESNDISVYPNPTTGIFTLHFGEKEGDKQVYISNISGKLVYSNTFEGNEVQIDMTGKPTGIYLVRIVSEGEVNVLQIILR
ncbi:MAG: DUF333 domain-containing protein [Paludibacteraceae bacterium]|nr:DUF333 domain-containing protein [Paludibacteraceae bacterium]